ncbi:MAG: twin-arginine translocase TatA/TatE family subunit [Nitrososphaerales archaeon]
MAGIENLALFVAGAEWIFIIIAIGVIFLGAKKIPELARSIGRATSEYERGRIDAEKEVKEWKGHRVERGKLSEVARSLGLDSENKSDDELRVEIDKVLQKEKS